MKTYKLYINGKWVPSSSQKTFLSINPSTKKPIAKFQEGNEEDVDRAVYAAETAFEKWSSVPAPRRAEYLLEVARILRNKKQELAKCIAIEMGKVMPEAIGDIQEAIDTFEYMAGEGRRLFGITTPSELKNKFCLTTRMPIGVVALITPWNFPIAIPSWKIAPALICGNAIIFKPSSDTPLCATKLIEILNEVNIPPGVINLITGPGDTVGNKLITHPKIRGISFTGSKATGLNITQNAGLKRVGLELGGKNAIIVMNDANLDLAVEGILWGAFGTTGQRCTAASRVIVHRKIRRKLESKLLKKIKKLKLGNPLNKNIDIGPLINQKAVEKTHRYTKIGIKEGAKLICGGKPINGNGFFYQPTVFTNVNPIMRIAQEEIFGPLLSIITIKDLNEAIKVCNSISYGLSSSIYTNSIENAFRAIEKIEAGITYINSSTIGAEAHLPFGGVKDTGNGTREGGSGIEEFSEIKTVYIDYSGKLQKAQIDIKK